MNIRPRSHTALAAALTLLVSVGCETLPPSTGDAAGQAAEDAVSVETRKAKAEAAAKKRSAREEELRELKGKLVKLARKRKAVEAELELAQQKAKDERTATKLGVASAERELAIAEKALVGFSKFTLPVARAESELAVDRSEWRLVQAREVLKETLVLYEDEVEAIRAKDIVIARTRKNVEFAERSLEITKKKAREKADKDLAEQQEKLEHAVKKAADSLSKVRRDAERQGLSAALDRLRKEHAIRDVKEDVADAERALEKLKREADEAEDGDAPPAETANE